MILGIVGKKRSGKSTFADRLVQQYGFESASFADPIKKVCAEIFGFTDAQLFGDQKEIVDAYWGVTPRKIMQVIGTEIFQFDLPRHMESPMFGRDFWVRAMEKRIGNQIHSGKNISIADVRFSHELDFINKMKGKIIRVYRPSLPVNPDQHPSEVELDGMKFPTFVNDKESLEEMHEDMDIFLRQNEII